MSVRFLPGLCGNHCRFRHPDGDVGRRGRFVVYHGNGQCLEMTVYRASITNGGAMTSSCNIPGVGTSGTSDPVFLVQ